MSIGNFLQLAEAQTGKSVGFCKMLLIYKEEMEVPIADMTAAAINAHVADKTIIGIIRNWNMIAGASVAEKSTEKTDGTMKVTKNEILADTFTFDDYITNRDVFERVNGKTFNCVLMDDMGTAYGEESLKPSSIKTMKINFSGKVTNGMQNDQTNEKTIMITGRYLLTKIGYVEADTAVEDVISLIPMRAEVSSITSQATGLIVFVLNVYNAETGDLLTTLDTGTSYAELIMDGVVNGITATPTATFATGQLTVTLTKTVANMSATTNKVKLSLYTTEYYLNEIKFDTADFTA
jgi:hypothetical protein